MLPYLFAADTKCLHAAKTNEDITAIQEDLNVACKWSKECSLSFNCSKSAVLHFCRASVTMTPQLNIYNNNYISYIYFINTVTLQSRRLYTSNN